MSARGDPNEAARAAKARAILEADEGERPYLRIIARCVLAAFDARRRRELFADAVGIGSKTGSRPMRAAICALLQGDDDACVLARFVLRSERGGDGAPIDVRILCGDVFVDGTAQMLSRSEFAVLVALARRPRSYSVVELGDLLYPELDADNAANRVHVYIHRLRGRLGRHAVLVDETGYRLGPLVCVDLWDLARIAAGSRDDGVEAARDLARVRAVDAISSPQFDAFMLRLRLPAALAAELRDAFERYRGACVGL